MLGCTKMIVPLLMAILFASKQNRTETGAVVNQHPAHEKV